ncbi:uncharacterized protein [Zea mays]|uniref:Uncharacterized protein n=1 Tax=Zea mays TaxID=4577 RepID=C0HF83_MAIZE|nr:uncharacterized protein LOC100277590 isoform X1 [Zea mays]ACN25686.1 unknown [Zea mays]
MVSRLSEYGVQGLIFSEFFVAIFFCPCNKVVGKILCQSGLCVAVLFLCSAAPKSLLPGAPVLGHRCSRRCAQPTQRQLPLRQREGAPKAPMLLLPVLQRVIDGSQKTTVALPIHKALMIVMMEPMLRPTTMMSLFPWDLNLQKTKRPWEEECDNEKVQLKTIGKDVALTVGQTPG